MIYFAQDSEKLYIKIGHSADPEGRVGGLQTGNPSRLVLLGTMDGGKEQEAQLHRRFAAAREIGEWFRPTPELLGFVIENSRPKTDVPGPHVPFGGIGRPYRIFFAGHMEGSSVNAGFSNWRRDIISDYLCLSIEDGCTPSEIDTYPVRSGIVPGGHDYLGGYFFTNCGHGDFGPDQHGCDYGLDVVNSIDTHIGGNLDQRTDVVRLCNEAIARCDLLFAWIDSLDRYGTVSEIAFARSLDKRICLAWPRTFRDMWFVETMADMVFVEDSPARAFDMFRRWL